ncbi:MAG: hypothetical protein PHS14_08190 [Elusimicrobia bacterium]|nr:hypothetical protein [Elusimicrobiota bacterium]
MKGLPRWALGVVAALVVLALMLVVPKLGAAVVTAALAGLAWLALRARTIADLVLGERGKVEGEGDTWAPVDGKPSQIDVWASSEDPAAARRVVLPEGMTAGQVRAVRVIPGGAAVVEVLP